MRLTIAFALTVAATLLMGPRAQAASTTWCAIDETENCTFSSLQQCLAGANSTNAICEPSNYIEDQQEFSPRVRRHTTKR
jgi:hypothetical protein